VSTLLYAINAMALEKKTSKCSANERRKGKEEMQEEINRR